MTKLFRLLSTTCFCFAAGAVVSYAIDRLTAGPPEWCAAACARWQMAGCPEGNDVCDGECISCLAACEREPERYPTGQCVANPPIGAGPMQDCTGVRAACQSQN